MTYVFVSGSFPASPSQIGVSVAVLDFVIPACFFRHRASDGSA
jgi:hypothetical protein